MPELLDMVLQAHGGLERWTGFDRVRAMFLSGGGLLPPWTVIRHEGEQGPIDERLLRGGAGRRAGSAGV